MIPSCAEMFVFFFFVVQRLAMVSVTLARQPAREHWTGRETEHAETNVHMSRVNITGQSFPARQWQSC